MALSNGLCVSISRRRVQLEEQFKLLVLDAHGI